jgi:signal transduction histidine kinase
MDEMRAAHPACTLRCESRGDLTGEWDPARLRQLISNLLGNAAQHGGETCRAEVSTRADGPDAVVLAVRNDGPPIPPESLPTIFDPLVRGPKPETRRRAGSIGLGLHIAREIVTAHGGTIAVTSSAEAGTTFTVRLPRRRSGG